MKKITWKKVGIAITLVAFGLFMACSDADEFTVTRGYLTADSNGQLGASVINVEDEATVTIPEGAQATLADGSNAAEGQATYSANYYDGEEAVEEFGGKNINYNGQQVDVVSAGAVRLQLKDANMATITGLNPGANVKMYLNGDIMGNTAAREAAQTSGDDLIFNPPAPSVGDIIRLYIIPCGENNLDLMGNFITLTVNQDDGGLYVEFTITNPCAKFVIVLGLKATTGTGGEGGSTSTT